MRITFDWNCVIEVEEGRAQAPAVLELVEKHQRGDVEVALLAASASENTQASEVTEAKKFPGNATIFKGRIARLGWDHLPIVLMPGVFGLSYFDFCFYVGDVEVFDRDIAALWGVIAPNVARDPKKFLVGGQQLNDEMIQSVQLAKWRNTWCDVISAYSHISAERDVFVTLNTRDFQKKSDALARLGLSDICDPNEMISRLVCR